MDGVVFFPLIDWPYLYAVMAVALFVTALLLWRRGTGWWLRTLASITLLIALANPALQDEERDPLSDIVVMVVDDTASNQIATRPLQTAEAVAELTEEIGQSGMELRVVRVPDGQGDAGSELMTVLRDTLAEESSGRIAGALFVTDGQLHDPLRMPEISAPVHTILTGEPEDWDRRLIIENAPAFAILGEEISMTLRIEDQGAVPADLPPDANVSISIDGAAPQNYRVPVGRDINVPLTLPHGGRNVLQFALDVEESELTDRNNAAVIQINGVRDRLRVLLVSGEPHAGERTWRNLLKSDSAVDLVHFTILRPPDKQDGVPVSELSLIAFPTRELFLEKVDEFDLIIFDRYKRRGILPGLYFDSISQYVRSGGAVLIAAGPDFATADSIYHSSLADVIPAEPTARVFDEAFKPLISELGARHPVTEGLEKFAPSPPEEGVPGWGRWMRQIEVDDFAGQTVMTGIEDKPLLTLDRVEDGRVALLASDHAWLWHRGYEGGGPQLELLRRLAHWMMKEPELEEEALTASAEAQTITITRRTLDEETGAVEVTSPDGTTQELALQEVSPGRFVGSFEGVEQGLYRIAQDDRLSVIALGPAAPVEFIETVASADKLAPLTDATRGGSFSIHDGIPNLRLVREDRNAAGRGWFGLTPRDAYLTTNVTITPLVSPWLFLLLATFFTVGAWLREGRR